MTRCISAGAASARKVEGEAGQGLEQLGLDSREAGIDANRCLHEPVAVDGEKGVKIMRLAP